MTNKPQVLSVGEVIVDFVSSKSGVTLKEAPHFEKCAGGAPANVAVGIARLGTASAFVGKVGDDAFGRFLLSELRASGVNTVGLTFDCQFKTRLAFVSLMNTGDREFEFWETHPADEQLHYSEIDQRLLAESAIVNVGSFLLLKNPSRRTALQVAVAARERGSEVCYDPNLRLSLWKSRSEAREVMSQMLSHASIVRLNREEAAFFTKAKTVETAAEKIRKLGPSLVVVTLAGKGCYFRTEMAAGVVSGFRVRVVDTTGCGDGFLAGLLHGLAHIGKKPDKLSRVELREICVTANAVGALVATKRGAIAAMPTKEEVDRFLQMHGRSVAS